MARAALVLGILLSVLALTQAVHKARQGRSALIKWRPQVEALTRGEMIYGRELGGTREGYPTLPVSALALRPFLALGDVPGATVWAAFKIALAWWMLLAVFGLVGGSEFPPWARVAVLLLSTRVLLSDVAHGNVNIPVAATVLAAAVEWRRGRELTAGLWIGLGAVLKVTPLLGLAYFAWKGSGRGLAGALAGIALFALVIPALFLGWSFNLELAGAWWRQMVEPFLAGAPLTLVQTEHVNQSFVGVAGRLLTDSVAIDARPPALPEAVNVLSLSPGAFRVLLASFAAAILGALAFCIPRDREGRETTRVTAAEFAMLALAMLLLSERSWKHHWVLLMLPVAVLTAELVRRPQRDRAWRTYASVLVATALLFGATGSGLLGAHGSDLAEAYGAYFWGGLALFAACGSLLRSSAGSGASP